MNVELTVVRHGQSEWNRDGICQGQEGNPPLTTLGKEQAIKTAALLRQQKFDGIVTSDLKRARQTAEILAKELELEIIEESSLLRERAMGAWAGQPLTTILEKHPLLHETGEFGVHHETPPNGESLTQFIERADEARMHLLSRYPGKRILVVTHGGFIQALRCVTERLSYPEALGIAPRNCEAITIALTPLLRRTPEVLDCWAESGAMPYAQEHFPFACRSGAERPPSFPADFIAEGIDQTRGWFYTLTVLSTAIFGHIPFRNCIVNGTVLASDGKKMSKRLKNYPEPLEIVEKYGADAVRFALMSSPAVRGEDLRFNEKLVEEVLRGVLLPLWNTYSFFVTYANAADFAPVATRRNL
jgi:broad specificity phosphatase PhoE